MKLGKRLRELRMNTGLSQEKFALKCGLDRTYIAGIEQGKRNISIESLEKIVIGLRITVQEFFKSEIFE